MYPSRRPSSRTYTPFVLQAISLLQGGIPRETSIKETEIPAAVERVKAEVRRRLRPAGRAPVRFSLAIDGGSSKLANGAKLVTVLVLTPEIEHDLVLGLEMRVSHEDANSQAQLLVRLIDEYGLDSADAVYIVGDNVAANNATVNLLRCKFDRALLLPCAAP